jgi:hypothetical protein
MVRVTRRWVLSTLKLDAVRAGKGPKIIVEGVIFLNNNYHVIDSVSQFSHSFFPRWLFRALRLAYYTASRRDHICPGQGNNVYIFPPLAWRYWRRVKRDGKAQRVFFNIRFRQDDEDA